MFSMSIYIEVFIIFTRLPPVGGVESTDASSNHHNIQLLKTRRSIGSVVNASATFKFDSF